MNSPEAYFLTAGGVHVTVRPDEEDGQYRTACDGCGWSLASREVELFAGGPIGRPAGALEGLKHDANEHALRCTELPRDLWPGDQPMTGRW
jgi:hypothetical protein